MSAVVLGGFEDLEVVVGGGGYGSEVSDAKDLATVSEAAHFLADGVGGFAADIGVHFVKNKEGDVVLGCENGFEGEHDAGDFSGRGDFFEGMERLAGVGSKKEFDAFSAGGAETRGFFGGFWLGRRMGNELDFKASAGEAEVFELFSGGFGEGLAFLGASGGEFAGAGDEFCFPLGDLAVDLLDFGVSGFEGFQFLAGLILELDDFF